MNSTARGLRRVGRDAADSVLTTLNNRRCLKSVAARFAEELGSKRFAKTIDLGNSLENARVTQFYDPY